MKYNDLINELLDLLDKDSKIIQIKKIKKKLLNDENLKENIENYRATKNLESKKKLYQNKDYVEYLTLENEINLMMYNIKSKFNTFNNRKCHHESN